MVVGLAGLIDVRQFAIGLLDRLNPRHEALLGRIVAVVDQIGDAVALPVEVVPGIAAGVLLEYLLEDFQVMPDGEGVAGVLVREEVVLVVVAGPGDRGEAQRTGLVAGDE